MTQAFTRADYDLLPEGFPAQLIEGMLVRQPAPTYGHCRFSAWCFARLVAILGPARVLHAPADVAVDDHNVYQPDVVVLREIPEDDVHDVGIPLLAVEVLSPSTAQRDRQRKCPRLLAAGVEEVWIVDPVLRTVELHTRTGRRLASGEEVLSSSAVPGFDVVPAVLFAPPPRS